MIDSAIWFGTHERIGKWILSCCCMRHNPVDVHWGDVFIWSQENKFFTPQVINDSRSRHRLWGDEIKNSIHESFHAAIRFCGWFEHDRRFRAAFWNVLVFKLLCERKAIDLVEESLRFAVKEHCICRLHDTKSTACNFFEADMKPVKASAIDKEDTEWQFGSSRTDEQRRVKPHRKGESICNKEVGAEHCLHGAQECGKNFARIIRVADRIDRGSKCCSARVEFGVGKWFRWIEARSEKFQYRQSDCSARFHRRCDSVSAER